VGQYDRAGRAGGRALRHVRRRPVADLRRHAPGQHRPRRPDRAGGLSRARRHHLARHRPSRLAADRGAADGGHRLPLQRGILNYTLGDDLLPPLLVTFGLSIIIQNGLLELFTADSRKLNAGAIEIATIPVAQGLYIGVLPLLQFVLAVAVIAGLQLLFYRTALGRAFRATSDDQAVSRLMGLDTAHVFGLAMALSLAVVAVAGVLLAIRANFDPSIGPARLIFGFEAVIIGGLGSMWGTLAGGIILGVAQAVGSKIDPGWQLLAGHLVFLLILAVRPQGLFPKVQG
jgi:branched-chain amino acid transport system permease protein